MKTAIPNIIWPVLLYILLTISGTARADDLISVYKQALVADPQYQAALEAHSAALEVVPQARSALLPNIGIGGDVSRERFDPRNEGETNYSTNQIYSIGLRQTLYQRERFIQLLSLIHISEPTRPFTLSRMQSSA